MPGANSPAWRLVVQRDASLVPPPSLAAHRCPAGTPGVQALSSDPCLYQREGVAFQIVSGAIQPVHALLGAEPGQLTADVMMRVELQPLNSIATALLLSTSAQVRLGGAGGDRTHDRRIMSPLL